MLTLDGKTQTRFDRNRSGGGYEISEEKLSFGPLMSTRPAGPQDTFLESRGHPIFCLARGSR